MNLQIAKWGNSLAVRIPAELVRQMGLKEGDSMQALFTADGAINLRPAHWSRADFAQELMRTQAQVPMGASVMEALRTQARY